MKKILVAINFSEQSHMVIKYAFRMAQYLGSEVGVVYVKSDNQLKKLEGKYVSDLKEEHLKIALLELDEFVSSHYGKQYHCIPVDTYSRIGNPSEEIAELAFYIKADLLIVGKHFQTKFSFFEDTSDALISINPCPVLTIPVDGEFHAWKRIIYASDFLLEDCAAIFEIQDWISIFKGELICIHVSKNTEQLTLAKRKMAILKKLFPQENIKFRCFEADVNKAIERYTSLTKADLLCTMHKDRNMFQLLFNTSVSKKLSHKSTRAIVVFHQQMMTSLG